MYTIFYLLKRKHIENGVCMCLYSAMSSFIVGNRLHFQKFIAINGQLLIRKTAELNCQHFMAFVFNIINGSFRNVFTACI